MLYHAHKTDTRIRKILQSENNMLINLLDAFYIKNVSVK